MRVVNEERGGEAPLHLAGKTFKAALTGSRNSERGPAVVRWNVVALREAGAEADERETVIPRF
jgi:hypothetical protein